MTQLKELYQQHFGVSLRWKLERGTSLFEGQLRKGKFRFQAENILMVLLLHLQEHNEDTMAFGGMRKLVEDGKEGGQPSPLQNYLKVLVEAKIALRAEGKGQEDPFE